jgi:predicted RND superfamily exporter protein
VRNYIAAIIKHQKLVLFVTALVTVGLISQLNSLQVISDPEKVLPQSNPFVITGNIVEKIFGNKLNAVIGVTANQGTIFQAPILEKVQRITDRLKMSPLVIKNNLTSLSSRKSKNIVGNSEGMVVTPLMEKIPRDEAATLELKKGLARNPAYSNLLISPDEKTTLIVAEFKQPPGGFVQVTKTIEDAVAPERDSSVTIETAGLTVFLSLLEVFSSRMAFLFPLAVLVIGLIHYEAFRTIQAMMLPLVTALLAVIWSIGLLGFMREPFDAFNAATPILILAIAAGHAVQILKRYYEEYSKVSKEQPNLSPKERNHVAVLNSLSKVGPVMVIACTVAALGFFSLVVFELKSIRTFGIFTGAGIVSALILELTFIPALRSILPAPSLREVEREGHKTIWDRIIIWFYTMTMFRRKTVYAVVGAIIVILSLGGMRLQIDNTTRTFFAKSNPVIVDYDNLNERLAGTSSLYALVEGSSQDSIKRPDVLHAMDDLQTYLNNKPHVGKTLSIVDFIKKMNESMNGDNKTYFAVPESQDLVAQYLLLYSSSGEPGDFDTYVDNDYQRAVVTVFTKTDSSSYIEGLVSDINSFAKEHFPKDVKVSVGGGGVGPVAINQVMIKEKILNILQIMGAVLIITSLVFRSPTAGLFILVPLVAAVFVNFGVMGLLGIPLQIPTALISAMAVGIGADYGIYMSFRMREELNASAAEEAAIEKAFLSAGKAVLFVSTAVAGGFGVLMLSFGFMIHIWMGFLISIAMLVSSIATLTVFPALIFTFRPTFIFNGKEQTAYGKEQTA